MSGFLFNNNVLNQKATPMLFSDTLANRPAAGIAYRKFFQTDSPFAIQQDNGTTWDTMAVGTSGITGLGTVGAVPLFTGIAVIGDSIITQSGGAILVAGPVSFSGTSPQITLNKTGGGSNIIQVNTDSGLQLGGNANPFIISSSGAVSYGSIPAMTTTPTRFLAIDVPNGNLMAYRTAAEILADIGAQASGNYITALTGDVTASGPGSVAATIANLAVTNAKIANSTIDLTAKVTGVLPGANGGTGVANTGFTITLAGSLATVGAFASTFTMTNTTTVTFPTTGTLATTAQLHNAVTLAAIGSTPNANGATLSTQVLNLEPASASFGGVVTTGTQIFAGLKTFNDTVTLLNELYVLGNPNIRMGSASGTGGSVPAVWYYSSDGAFSWALETHTTGDFRMVNSVAAFTRFELTQAGAMTISAAMNAASATLTGSEIVTASAQTTAAVYSKLSNTSGGMICGIASSTGVFGGTSITNMTAYAGGIGTTVNKVFEIFSNSTVSIRCNGDNATVLGNFAVNGGFSSASFAGTGTRHLVADNLGNVTAP